MGCKHCKKVVHIRQKGNNLIKFDGNTAFFVAKPGFDKVEFVADDKKYVFYENKQTEAPVELRKVNFLKMVKKESIIKKSNFNVTEKVESKIIKKK